MPSCLGTSRFVRAMDPDPRYWDDAFARTTKYGQIITPPIYCTYLGRRAKPGTEDPVTRAFEENPESDGIGGVRTPEEKGGLPNVPTPLVRILNAGNEIEVRQYPKIGDHIYSQARYSDIRERVAKDGARMSRGVPGSAGRPIGGTSSNGLGTPAGGTIGGGTVGSGSAGAGAVGAGGVGGGSAIGGAASGGR